jgi:DNA repair protein RecO (recombination protein O)
VTGARLYKTEAIVLRQRRLGEADRVLTLFTPGHGKLDVKAKGVRKTTSRMSGHLQPLTRCALQLAQGHAGDVVAGCETLESFQSLRDDLDRLSRALYAAELVDRLTPERSPAFATYRLLAETLRRLAEADDPDMVLRFTEMRLLDQAGFRPQLDACAACGGGIAPERQAFAPDAGGAVCPVCMPGAVSAPALSPDALKVLRLLQRGPYRDVMRVRMPAALAQEVERHLHSYIVSVLERDVNAAAFIQKLRRQGALHTVEV